MNSTALRTTMARLVPKAADRRYGVMYSHKKKTFIDIETDLGFGGFSKWLQDQWK